MHPHNNSTGLLFGGEGSRDETTWYKDGQTQYHPCSKFTNVHNVIGLWVVSKPVIKQGKLGITEGHGVGLKDKKEGKEGKNHEGITTSNNVVSMYT